MSEDVPRYGEPPNPYIATDGAALSFMPANRSRCTIGGLVITSPTPAPNRFWRIMQRWCLGIVWEVIDQD